MELIPQGDRVWLVIEDNGIGMSEQVLTGPLLDFGTSFWRSSLAMEEFPGLMAAGMHAIGRFGIGFLSVFMLGSVVRVYSRRFDREQDDGRLLEFRGGTSGRPILSCVAGDPVPIDGGTRVDVLLNTHPYKPGGLLRPNPYSEQSTPLAALVGAVAPNLDVNIATIGQGGSQIVVRAGDWLMIADVALLQRLNPNPGKTHTEAPRSSQALMQPIEGSGLMVLRRAFISPSS